MSKLGAILVASGAFLIGCSCAAAPLAMVVFTAQENKFSPLVEFLGVLCFWGGPVALLCGIILVVAGIVLGITGGALSSARQRETR